MITIEGLYTLLKSAPFSASLNTVIYPIVGDTCNLILHFDIITFGVAFPFTSVEPFSVVYLFNIEGTVYVEHDDKLYKALRIDNGNSTLWPTAVLQVFDLSSNDSGAS